MNVGEDKGRIVTDVIKEVKPKVMVRDRIQGHGGNSEHIAMRVGKERDKETDDELHRSNWEATLVTRKPVL